MKPLFPEVVIVGLGLIGGSLALELKKKKAALRVVGVSTSAENRDEALRRKAVDEAYAKPGDFLRRADLVVIATPVSKILPLLQQIKKFLKKGALVTDVGSVKGEIVRQASRLKDCQFIGGHPIAGTEKSGMKAAQLDLFQKRKWILTPTVRAQAGLRKKLIRWIRALGAEVVLMDPADHDRIFAAVSHLPNLLAYTLANAVESLKDPKALSLSGSSLRDMTRVAGSPPEMWRDICIENRVEVLRMVRRFESEFNKFKQAIEKGWEADLYQLFEKGKKFRDKL
ncbi:MAG: prephenate dehydrogenase/arogenate dehydrogenase family protein [bacterium]